MPKILRLAAGARSWGVPGDARQRGLDAFGRRAWGEAFALLADADEAYPLDAGDLELAGLAAALVGRDDDCDRYWIRAHQAHLDSGDARGAARMAIWLGFTFFLVGEDAKANGWMARGQRLLDEAGLDGAERGYLLVPPAMYALYARDNESAAAQFGEAGDIARRFADADLLALAWCGRGQALMRLGRVAEGVGLLDEALVAVTAGEIGPLVSGIAYCASIEAFHEVFDLRRAREWTTALSRWCASQPDLVPFRGSCLVHRVEVMQLGGAWPQALEEVLRACDLLTQPPQPAAGEAHYLRAELHRLAGRFDEAEEAYRLAAGFGRPPQPGLALLRLAQDRPEAAAATSRRVLEEATDWVSRCKVLPAHVEIMLAAGDVDGARAAADELAGIAGAHDAPLLRAVAHTAVGSVLLAEGDAGGACATLRRAEKAWCDLDAPYQAARTRVLLGLACRQLGDDDGAALELDAARAAFRRLGAAVDLSRVPEPAHPAPARAAGGLTAREVEVLGLVASGRTNRAIAESLFISEKTVARHVSNIFTKLGLGSRSAATAYAYEQGLV